VAKSRCELLARGACCGFVHPQESMRLEVCGRRFSNDDLARATIDGDALLAHGETRLVITGFFWSAEMEEIPWRRAVLEFL
jgi:hypothetical protein